MASSSWSCSACAARVIGDRRSSSAGSTWHRHRQPHDGAWATLPLLVAVSSMIVMIEILRTMGKITSSHQRSSSRPIQDVTGHKTLSRSHPVRPAKMKSPASKTLACMDPSVLPSCTSARLAGPRSCPSLPRFPFPFSEPRHWLASCESSLTLRSVIFAVITLSFPRPR